MNHGAPSFPMETVPLDGTSVLLVFSGGREHIAWWHKPSVGNLILDIPGYWEYTSSPIGPGIPVGWRPVP